MSKGFSHNFSNFSQCDTTVSFLWCLPQEVRVYSISEPFTFICNTVLGWFTILLWGHLTDARIKNKHSPWNRFWEIRALILGICLCIMAMRELHCLHCSSSYRPLGSGVLILFLSGVFAVGAVVFIPFPKSEMLSFVSICMRLFSAVPFVISFILPLIPTFSLTLSLSGTLC